VAERICVAQIGGAHGLRGEVKLKSFTGDPMAVADYAPLTSEDGASFEIEALRPAKGHLVARFRGIEDRTSAERLANVRLFVPRERLPPLAADEFYHADLIGLCAVKADGTEIGTVVAVHDFGAGDILELAPRGSATRGSGTRGSGTRGSGTRGSATRGSGTSIMVPFTAAFVPSVDILRGRVVVVPPEDVTETSSATE
jgi:16S rRNA processing protein RimM